MMNSQEQSVERNMVWNATTSPQMTRYKEPRIETKPSRNYVLGRPDDALPALRRSNHNGCEQRPQLAPRRKVLHPQMANKKRVMSYIASCVHW
eukprot:6179053-Pleurochrysis_carterae.AAC.2